jgi:hypothetical protein
MYQLEVTVRSGSRAVSTPVRESAVRDHLCLRRVKDMRFTVEVVSNDTFILKTNHRPLAETLEKALQRRDFIIGQIVDTDFLPRRRRALA